MRLLPCYVVNEATMPKGRPLQKTTGHKKIYYFVSLCRQFQLIEHNPCIKPQKWIGFIDQEL